MNTKFLKFIALIVVSTLLFACQSNTPTNQNTEGSENDVLDKAEITEDVAEVVYPLPSPFELVSFLNDIGAVFEGDILNPTANVDNYITEKDKAINLGVYGADLSYAITYEKKPLSNKYLKSLKELIDGLGITVDYDFLIEDNNKDAFSNKDSLVSLVSQTFYETYSFLNNNSAPSFAALMTAGFWVEGMFIATHISEYTFDNTEIVTIIFNQKESLYKLLNLLGEYKEDEHVASILTILEKIKVTYDNTETSLTQAQLAEIKSSIASVRAILVK